MKEDLEIQARPGNNSQRLNQEDDKFKTSLHPWLHREFKGSLGISDKPPPRRKSERKEKKEEGDGVWGWEEREERENTLVQAHGPQVQSAMLQGEKKRPKRWLWYRALLLLRQLSSAPNIRFGRLTIPLLQFQGISLSSCFYG